MSKLVGVCPSGCHAVRAAEVSSSGLLHRLSGTSAPSVSLQVCEGRQSSSLPPLHSLLIAGHLFGALPHLGSFTATSVLAPPIGADMVPNSKEGFVNPHWLGSKARQACAAAEKQGPPQSVTLRQCAHWTLSLTPLSTWMTLDQWVSAFLMLRPFNTAPHVVVTPKHKIIFVAIS